MFPLNGGQRKQKMARTISEKEPDLGHTSRTSDKQTELFGAENNKKIETGLE